MKLDIISESIRPLNCKVGFVFFGKASELKDAVDILAGLCPRCMGELEQEVFTTIEGEDIVEATRCEGCGRVDVFSDE